MTVILKKASSVISSFFQHTPGTQVADPTMFLDPELEETELDETELEETEVGEVLGLVEAEFTYMHLH
jgi:hypothetical protein